VRLKIKVFQRKTESFIKDLKKRTFWMTTARITTIIMASDWWN
jgi:hypothetical protein